MFFEPPSPGEEEKRPPQPPWIGPPEAELGEAVPLRAVLAEGDKVVIALTDCAAYSNGFEFGFTIRGRETLDPARIGFGRMIPTGGPLPDDLLRLGVQFSDGRKATTIGPPAEAPFKEWSEAVREGREPMLPEGPILIQRGGGGGGTRWDHRYWVWPLPPEGPLAFACEWPVRGIALTLHKVDASAIREAAGRSRRLWDDREG